MQKKAEAIEQKPPEAHPTQDEPNTADRRSRPVPTSEPLASRLRHGDRVAAAELVDRYYERIYVFMRGLGHGPQTSEDLVQETFLRAWHHIGQLRDDKALNGWIYRIASNVSRLYWRRLGGHRTTSLEHREGPATRETGVDQAGRHEQFDRLHEAVAQLPFKLRQAIVLHYLEHLTIGEAAEAAAVRQGTFKSRLNRGLEALRAKMT